MYMVVPNIRTHYTSGTPRFPDYSVNEDNKNNRVTRQLSNYDQGTLAKGVSQTWLHSKLSHLEGRGLLAQRRLGGAVV